MVEDNCNPMYFQAIDFILKCESRETAPPIILNIWDYNSITKDELIGTAAIFLKDAVTVINS